VKISTRRMDNTTVLDISGDIDMAHSTELRRVVLVEIRESRTPRVVLNMLDVRYIDSSGVASLVEGLKASRDVGSRMILVSLSPFVQEILRLTRLLQIFEIYDTEEKALES
jgi:anti-sigma B factor antagonist